MRVVIFTDANTVTPAKLVRATLRFASNRTDCRVVGFVTTRPSDFRFGFPRRTAALLRRVAVAATNPDVPFICVREFELDLHGLGRRHRIPLLVPAGDDLNDPAFIRNLVATTQPDVALSFYCRHRFGRPLRSVFAQTINYHDGLLPDYRGVMATAFSIYAGETRSGLTFHHMTGKLDGGPILLQDDVSIDESSTLDDVVRRKSVRAEAALPRVLELVLGGDPGRPQTGKGSFFTAHDWMAMTHLSRPENATSGEIRRRIRAFGLVNLTIGEKSYVVTRIRPARSGETLAFRTADKLLLAPARFAGLPAICYQFGTLPTDQFGSPG